MRSKYRLYILAIVSLSILFSFCSRPKEVHNKKEMERIMYDIYIAEAIIDHDYNNFNTPEQKEAVINEVFKKNKTTQARWDTSLAWYSDKVGEYLKMNDSVRARIQRRQKQIETIVNNEMALEQSVKDRTIMTSEIPSYYSFSEINPKNGFRFKLDSTYIKENIDSLNTFFSFDAIGIPNRVAPLLTSQLILEYKDTTMYKSDIITTNGNHTITFKKYIDGDTLQSLLGFVRLQDSLRLFRDIQLMNIQIGNDHNKDSLSIDTTAVSNKELGIDQIEIREITN